MTDMEDMIVYVEGVLHDHEDLPIARIRTDRLTDILALLREQEPVKPIFDEEDVSGRCGVCGHPLTHQSMIGDVLVDEWFQYCPICGRKVDWNA